jgi:hypothetical protein
VCTFKSDIPLLFDAPFYLLFLLFLYDLTECIEHDKILFLINNFYQVAVYSTHHTIPGLMEYYITVFDIVKICGS